MNNLEKKPFPKTAKFVPLFSVLMFIIGQVIVLFATSLYDKTGPITEHILVLLMYGVTLWFVFKFMLKPVLREEKEEARPLPAKELAGIILLTFIFEILFTYLIDFIFKSSTIPSNQEVIQDIAQHAPFAMFSYAVLIAPIIEELLFRYAIPRVVKNVFKRFINVKTASGLGLLVGMFLFTYAHSGLDLEAFMRYVPMTVVFTYVREHYKSTLASIKVHMTWNGLAVLFTIIQLFAPQ